MPNRRASTLLDRRELDRLAEIGIAIARADYPVSNLRRSNNDASFRYGFDVASALFGDSTLGSQGSTVLGPGSLHIRASLEATAQSGFDQSANFHFSRRYRP